MSEQQFRSRSGGFTALGQESVEEFYDSLSGKIIIPQSPGYDQARSVWNAMIDRRPAMIVRCTHADDVVQAVRFARDRDILVTVRGGGHNIAGSAVCDGGMVIDLSPMKSVQIDPTQRMARVEPGVTLGEFDRDAQAHGLATPLGINSTTGVSGLTLGGGFGWLSRRLGLSIDNLLSAEMVLVSGEKVTVSHDQNPDLFWAIRGGGGNFGVVTAFHFRLHRIGPEVLSGLIVHPLEHAPEVLRFYREFVRSTPEEFTCFLVLRKAPPLPFLPEEWYGKGILALGVCYSGDNLEEGERIAAPLRAFGHPIADVISPHQFTDWQMALDPLLTPGMRNYWKSHNLLDLPTGLMDVLVDYAQRIPDPQTEIALAQLGGAINRVPVDATAYPHRDVQFALVVHGRWEDPAKDDECIQWSRNLFRAAEPYASGAFVNFLTEEEKDRVRLVYGANYDRLVQIKNRYDPSNLFSTNQNIRPTV